MPMGQASQASAVPSPSAAEAHVALVGCRLVALQDFQLVDEIVVVVDVEKDLVSFLDRILIDLLVAAYCAKRFMEGIVIDVQVL